ncbi:MULTISPECIES: phosphotransferase [unclassified Geodermatophilus]|uniref:phosphotransferase n=1 Tax=unclassified Geodermatophilus TaxID=2637632 RepID=UPI003EECDDD1
MVGIAQTPAEGVPLGGGRTTAGVVRIGSAVHRPARPWTAAVHAVLRHLEAAGFEGAPRVLGVDAQGREVLSFLEGETVGERRPWPSWVHADTALADVGAWLRRLHDVTARFVPPEGATWFSGRPWRPGLVIGHHDAAPYNAVWRTGHVIGFVDWDTASPSSPELDLAYAALQWVPLLAAGSAWPHAATPVPDASRRLHLLLDAYGFDGDRRAFGAVVAERARINAAVVRRLADGGDPAYAAIRRQADDLERSAVEVEARPASFWQRPAPPER